MKKRFKAVVNSKHHFDLTSTDVLPYQKIDTTHVHAIEDHHSINAEIHTSDFLNKKYVVKLDAAMYEIELKNELDLLIEELGLSANVASITNELTAPMPGLIVDVLTKAGESVKTGDGLIVLEAMKMENKLIAPQDGVVKKVHVQKSDAVEKGMVLIEFENNEENK